MLYVAALVAGEAGSFNPATVSVRSLAALGYLIVFGSVVAFSAYSWLLRRTSLAAVSTYAFVNPIVAVTLGWALGDEPMTGRIFAAAVLVIVGVVMMRRGGAQRHRAPGHRQHTPSEKLGVAHVPGPWTPSHVSTR